MDIEEIMSFIQVGRSKSICVDRCLMKQYPGFVRDIVILDDCILRVEFNVYDSEEGGLIIKIAYKNYDLLINAISQYINNPLERWENISKTGWYPELSENVDYNESGRQLKGDLVGKRLQLPEGGSSYEIPQGYWRDIANGVIAIEPQ